MHEWSGNKNTYLRCSTFFQSTAAADGAIVQARSRIAILAGTISCAVPGVSISSSSSALLLPVDIDTQGNQTAGQSCICNQSADSSVSADLLAHLDMWRWREERDEGREGVIGSWEGDKKASDLAK